MQIVDLRGKLLTHKTKRYSTRKESDIRSIAIHHSLTVSGSPEAFATYHVNTNGWPGIAYPYVIQRDGTIYKCHDHNVVTYHVGNSNKHALGICLVGDFRTQHPTTEQYAAAIWLVRKLQQELSNAKEVKGHSQYPGYSWKACPVISMDKFIADLVNGVQKGDDEELKLTDYQWKVLSLNIQKLLDQKVITDVKWLEKVQLRTLTNSELNWLNNVVVMRLT
ncbi:peptidoglycan recognition protein family protein [Paenibacillus camelliae]|uniref:peptidoglycan recognition protein family protein n=1 Tax=Paenibacillus camelliae TaxID=512410 RepID=UPI00203AFF55|nr:peptidoglycan recognition family protein [Paenibacillus camelliae]MCM3632918.1 peptidoglycan recognition protein family protein [Paenibacillus camelliae]